MVVLSVDKIRDDSQGHEYQHNNHGNQNKRHEQCSFGLSLALVPVALGQDRFKLLAFHRHQTTECSATGQDSTLQLRRADPHHDLSGWLRLLRAAVLWLLMVGESIGKVATRQRLGYNLRMGQLTKAIAAAVKASDQTPYAIAKGAGVARSQLSRLLSGERGLNTDTIEKLADYLGLRITIEPKGKTRKGR